MILLMPTALPPQAPVVLPSTTLVTSEELPLLPGSDPMILGVYQWTVAHSPSLQQVVRQLARAERKARYRLMPGLDLNYGRLVVEATGEAYDIDIQVAVLPWRRCGDALEPWIATAVFLALEAASKGDLQVTHDSHRLTFLNQTRAAAFAFQAKVRKELVMADPLRLKGLPDGLVIFQRGFPSSFNASSPPRQRALPGSESTSDRVVP